MIAVLPEGAEGDGVGAGLWGVGPTAGRGGLLGSAAGRGGGPAFSAFFKKEHCTTMHEIAKQV